MKLVASNAKALAGTEKPLAGDKQIQDLTPKTTNLGDRLVKNMRICGSGIYTYSKREAPLLHLDPIPEKYRNLDFINVYRPPEVLRANKDKFARVPIITGHHVLVNRDNAKDLVVGMVGDTVDEEVDTQDGELYLYTTGTIVAGDGVNAYEQFGQLSVGYDPKMEWCDGEHNGVPYQARLVGFEDVNHLLICKTARGGPQCMVMDSLDGLSPLERIIASTDTNVEVSNTKASITGDAKTSAAPVDKTITGDSINGGRKMFGKIFGKSKADTSVVSTLLQSIAVGADPTVQVPKIKQLCAGDETFNGYLDELASAKGEDLALMAKAVDVVEKYYNSHLAGDEAKPMGDEEKKVIDVEKKADGKKDVQVKEEKDGEEKEIRVDHEEDDDKKVTVEKKSAGDAIDYDLLAEKVAAKLGAKPQTAGDEVTEPVQGTVVIGDSAGQQSGKSSADFMAEMFS